MAKVRDSKATKNKIIKAAVKEITEHGYDATTVSGVARRARVSKQLLSHHFPTKEELFSEVHDFRTRSALLDENLPSNPADLMAERFRLRSKDVDYVRFLTWE